MPSFLKRVRSKWFITEGDGRLLRPKYWSNGFKTRTEAERQLELLEAYSTLANGWNRCTPRQVELLKANGE